MKYELRLSLDIEFETSELPVLPEAAGTDFIYLKQLLDALSRIIHDTPWPASRQGEFIDYVVRDVYEFGCAIRTEAEAGRWTVAMALMRPLQERSEYALAAAVDTTFPKRYIESINEQIDKNFTARSRQLADIARGAIDRWARKSHGQDGLLEVSIRLNKVGSEILHRAIGLSGEAEEIVKVRPGLLTMASGRVQCALVNVMLAIKVIGGNDTEAGQEAQSIVTLS